jgi:hypothetical protein
MTGEQPLRFQASDDVALPSLLLVLVLMLVLRFLF